LPIKRSSVYRSRPVKRVQRTQDTIRELKGALYELVRQAQPVTVRQVFYLAVAAALIEKTENAYKHTVVDYLVHMRRAGQLP
jgi:hypothetical protein